MPHHVIIRPSSLSTKLRVVFDASAKEERRQIEVHPNDQSYQRILWRDANNQIIEYELSTVTYGTACAPFIAKLTLHQLATDEQTNFPQASEWTMKDMYVDDFISGCDTIEEAQKLQAEVVQLFQKSEFNLRNLSQIVYLIIFQNQIEKTSPL